MAFMLVSNNGASMRYCDTGETKHVISACTQGSLQTICTGEDLIFNVDLPLQDSKAKQNLGLIEATGADSASLPGGAGVAV